jgi:membrane dipeptidase
MNRREFACITGGAAISRMLSSSLLAQESSPTHPQTSGSLAELYKHALVLDCNSFPPFEDGQLPLPQNDLDMVRQSGISVIKCSIGGINGDFAEAVKEIAHLERMIEMHPSYFEQVRLPADLGRAKREGKMGIIFSFESVEMLEGNLDRFDLFRNFGVRVMQLSYNRKSPFAAGVMEPKGGGLTASHDIPPIVAPDSRNASRSLRRTRQSLPVGFNARRRPLDTIRSRYRGVV